MSNSKSYTPFTFTTSFDELEKSELQIADEEKRRIEEEEKERLRLEEEARLNPPPPPPPTFSEEELQQEKAASFEEGRQAGLAEALGTIENESKDILNTLIGLFAVLQDKQSLANESQAAALTKIVFEMMRKLMPAYSQKFGLGEIEKLVYANVAQLESKGKVKISIPEKAAELTKKNLEQVIVESGFEGRIVYFPDPALGPSDVKIDWGHGSTERNLNKAIMESEQIINNFIENHLDTEQDDFDLEETNQMEISTPAHLDSSTLSENESQENKTVSQPDIGETTHITNNDMTSEPSEEIKINE